MKVPNQGDKKRDTDMIISFPPVLFPRSLLGRATRPLYAYDTVLKKLSSSSNTGERVFLRME